MLRTIGNIYSIIKKITLVIIVLFIVVNLFLYFMSANKPTNVPDPIKKNRDEIYKTINNLELQKTQQGKATAVAYKMSVCALLGEACTDNPNDANRDYGKSIMGSMGNLIAAPYANPPASGLYWAYSGLQNAGFIPQTYAAEGIGFSAIKPLMNIWKVMRDFSYMVLVIIIVIIGFMIMFRMKLNPQTVISVENALPKIVISLVLITFSFAIAGFLIDLMYVFIVISISLLAKADPSLNAMQLQNSYVTANFGNIWDSMFTDQSWVSRIPLIGGFTTLTGLGNAVVGLLPQQIGDSVRIVSGGLAVLALGGIILDKLKFIDVGKIGNGWSLPLVGGSTGQASQGPLSIALAILVYGGLLFPALIFGAGWILGIVFIFTMIFLLFRIFFLLLTSYIKVILFIIFSPLFLLFEAIPGRNVFSFWLKNLVGELFTFPFVIFILVAGRVLVNIFNTGPSLPNLPIIGNSAPEMWHPPFLYGIDPHNFSILIGMGLIFMIPELTKTAKELLGIKGLPVGLNMGAFFSGVGTAGSGATNTLGKFGSLNLGLNAIMGNNNKMSSGGLLGMLGIGNKEKK